MNAPALAARRPSVHIKVAKTVKVNHPYRATIYGFAPRRQRLDAFLDPQRCASTAAAEHRHKGSARLRYSVKGKFKKRPGGTFNSSDKGRWHICAYLESPKGSHTHARATATFKVV